MGRWIAISFLVLSFLLGACGEDGRARIYTYYSEDTPVMIQDEDFVSSDILVTGAPTFVSRVTVTVAILHTYVSDLDLVLWSPEGNWIYLTNNDSDGEDFWYTTFDDFAPIGIWQTDSFDDPRTGSYRPNEPLGFFAGEFANGWWTLDVVDEGFGDVGYLVEWSIQIQ